MSVPGLLLLSSVMKVKTPIYMDNHATTPVDPSAMEAMIPYVTDKFANAASRSHAYGWESGAAVATAREQIAKPSDASPRASVFTTTRWGSVQPATQGVP